MPNLRNAVKQVRKDIKRTARNMTQRADLKTLIKKTRRAIEAKEKSAEAMIADIQQKVDKMAGKGLIKKNTAARILSRVYAKKKKLA